MDMYVEDHPKGVAVVFVRTQVIVLKKVDFLSKMYI